MKPTEVKEILSRIISSISDDPSDFLQNPSKDFTRNRKLSFEAIIKMMIGMGGNSLYMIGSIIQKIPHLVSAFVQQRNKISSKAMEYIFREMIKQCDEQILFKGYRLLAIDRSDIRLPKNKNDDNSYIQNDENTKGYNLLHLDAMYDLKFRIVRFKISERSLLKIVQKFMSPIRPGRVLERYQNIKNAVGFAYRIY